MLIIDTNTLYYAFGLSTHNSISGDIICQTIDANSDVRISSISFAELIAKYNRHAGIVRRVCCFMKQHHITICNNKYIALEDDIIKKLSTIKQKELTSFWDALLKSKSNYESKFAVTVFMTVLFSETIFECNINPNSVPDYIYDFFSKIYKDVLRKVVIELFEISYQKAYKTDDAENEIRHIFYKYLKLCISLCIPLCKYVLKECDEIPEGEIVDTSKIIKKYSNEQWAEDMTRYQRLIDKQKTPAHFVKSKGLSYGKSIKDKHLSSLLGGLDISFKKTIGTTSIEEYLYSIVSNTISNGGAFRKNDINDALILADMNPSDLMLTFDTRMIKHIQRYSDSRIEYKNSVDFINSIYGRFV